MRLLLVEDEASIRSAMVRGLTLQGHTVVAAGSLVEARALVAAQRPEALVSDLKLPDGNGLDLAEEFQLPAVMMTGYGTFDDAVRAMRLGAVDFFTKPVPIKDIAKALERIAARLGGGPTVLDPGPQPRLVQHGATGLAARVVRSEAVAWTTPATAAAAFPALAGVLPGVVHRQVAAELMQAAPTGRLVVNLLPDAWSAWLEAGVEWLAQPARRQLLEELCRSCAWRPDGALVECRHG